MYYYGECELTSQVQWLTILVDTDILSLFEGRHCSSEWTTYQWYEQTALARLECGGLLHVLWLVTQGHAKSLCSHSSLLLRLGGRQSTGGSSIMLSSPTGYYRN